MIKCEKYQELILLDRYGEIDEVSRRALNKHLAECPICAAEKVRTDDIFRILDKKEEAEIDPEWLKSMRNQMVAHLQVSKARAKTWSFDWDKIWGIMRSPALKFAYSAMLLVVGFGIGKFQCTGGGSIMPELHVGQMAGQNNQSARPVDMQSMLEDGKLRNVDLQELPDQQVQVSFQGTQDYQLVGTPEDKNIQEVLAYIMLHESNTGLRMRSLEQLSQQPDSLVQQLMIYSVLNDENEGVRLKAIRTLHNYPLSASLKQAYIRALMTDSNSAVRIEAMEGLRNMTADEQVRDILAIAAANDANDYVKLLAKNALDAYELNSGSGGMAIEKLKK